MADFHPDVSHLLASTRATWLVTGAAGFIGSNLVEALLKGGQKVIGFDNFATGHQRNLDELQQLLPDEFRSNFRMIRGDIRERQQCESAIKGVDYVLHQAALGSVPRSVDNPLESHDVNVTGFINMLDAARGAQVKRFVYAASSATYGDEPTLPKREDLIGQPLSPYGATKLANEIYAAAYGNTYGFKSVGLRYFNVFGPRQDPDGAYAAVIPKWTAAMIKGDEVTINGDGENSRDFCYVTNAVQANLRAAFARDVAKSEVYNIALGQRTTLLELFTLIKDVLAEHQVHYRCAPRMADYRAGDIRHSQADISKARIVLNYEPTHEVRDGLKNAMPWYLEFFSKVAAQV